MCKIALSSIQAFDCYHKQTNKYFLLSLSKGILHITSLFSYRNEWITEKVYVCSKSMWAIMRVYVTMCRMTSMLPGEEDPLSASALARWAQQETCRHLTPPPFRPPLTSLAAGLRGLACRHNRSISLLALDSALFGHFAKGLGVDPELVKGHTRVLLVDSQV